MDSSPKDRRQAAQRAAEWRQFRASFLYSQSDLACALKCCKRTVISVESAEVLNPHPRLLRRFRELQHAEFERARGRVKLATELAAAQRTAKKAAPFADYPVTWQGA